MKKESAVIAALDEDAFWKGIFNESIKRMWNKEDEVWDKLHQDSTKKIIAFL